MRIGANIVAAALLAVAALAPAAAGESTCDMPLQECIDLMVANIKDRGWLGIEYEINEEKGTSTVLRVVPGSPAEAAGFRPGDVLLFLDDVDLRGSDESDRAKIAAAMVPGNTVVYTVERDGRKKKLKAKLAPVSHEILSQWIGRHMLEHYDAPQGDEPADQP